MEQLKTEVLVVGGGTGGTAAAVQAARRGAKTLLVSEFPWLGGMLTAAGVSAPDGNELAAFQTGLWGAFLRALAQRQPGGLNHAWVSFFTYEPAVGAAIFADWVKALPNLTWRWGHRPRAVLRQGDRILGVDFEHFSVRAQITIDGTELGDLLALGEVPLRWGWEVQSQWQEPSAPRSLSDPQDPLYPIVQRYPVQAPTWVVLLQDYGDAIAPLIPPAPIEPPDFSTAWAEHGAAAFLNYGRLPGNRFMINWPQQGNDYGEALQRLIGSNADRQDFWQAARWHTQQFAHFIQTQLGRRYGLASDCFPKVPSSPGGGAYALYPYYRESRRLIGLATVSECDILPAVEAQVAPLPLNSQGEVSAIAVGNYPNDHHYPGFELPLASRSLRWGGRWTGIPFTIPYEALVPAAVNGLLACDKNISVSHIANGATRLQPVVLSVGQAAGMAAALCLEQGCAPRTLPVRSLQNALLQDAIAPLAVVPCFNLLPSAADWVAQQQQYLDYPERYPLDGNAPGNRPAYQAEPAVRIAGLYHRLAPQQYQLSCLIDNKPSVLALVTLHPTVEAQLKTLPTPAAVVASGSLNLSGNWLLVTDIYINES
ncbi:MAG: FAD-dependent oxidoreductase [Leptolyngbya sp. SIO4C1]|nr:FAD-dependent oxidoreductase [Leptolyngbya sp. SIO4C1]